MKLKIYLFSLIAGLFFLQNSKAQLTTCNAGFTVGINGYTASFVPLMPGDSINTYHNWSFGDGSASTLVYPVHVYANPGVYTIKHIIKRFTPNGAPYCADTSYQTITLLNTTPCNLAANFTYLKDSINPKKVYFTNTTLNINSGDSVKWTFGDNTPPEYSFNATHTYVNPGTYNVCLRVKRNVPAGTPPCVSEICKAIVIDNPVVICNLQAYFTFAIDSINSSKVKFYNQTQNLLATDSVRWNFGDGSPFSYSVNADHIYAQPGTYTVCLKVKRNLNNVGTPCVSEFCKVVVIQPNTPPCNIQAYFSHVFDSLNHNKVYFTNQTVNYLATDSIRWSFGDGSPFNYSVNPNHTYTLPGTYTVCIRVKRNMPSGIAPCVSEFCKIIVIQSNSSICNIQANFSNAVTPANPLKIFFTNQTVNFLPTDSIRWNFGDGTPFSYQVNPDHTYAQPGLYNVCIRVKRTLNPSSIPCISEYCRQIYVGPTISNCNYITDFTSRLDSTNNRKVYFTNISPVIPGATAYWSFGDGTTGTGWNTSHIYANGGSYNACLKVVYSYNCIKEKCRIIQLPNATTACILQPYPNPASFNVNATVHLTQPATIYTRVYNSQNIIVRQKQQPGFVGFNTVTVNVATLPIGIYRLVINYGNKECRGTFMKN